ncbi:PQQ-dependent dehydrogenase, methanol/ethanol family [Haliea sp. E17]|uniref:PQQ-dependent dehydrogenase, methanol/ethanol family n=1 Tax=Haliea sp. E17 TaxID=3401576 RepID=UPI003AAB0BE3
MQYFRLFVLSLAVAGAGCSGDKGPTAPDPQQVPAVSAAPAQSAPAAADSTDWPNFGGDGREQHYSPLAQVNLDTVGKLKLAWYYDLEDGFSVSTPVKGGDKLFTTTGHSHIRAFDAASGKLLWEYDAGVREIAQSPLHLSWGNKGIAWWDHKVYLATTDGRVIALDDSSGEPVWEARQYALDEIRYSNGAPRVFDGKVIIGHGGADITPIRGYVTAYDAENGEQLWRFYTTPGDPNSPATSKAEEMMRATWNGDWYGKGGGGTAWNAFSYDAELDLLYLGVGNGFPYNHLMRSPGGGDNLFLASIVAVKPDTGEYVWHYQVCPAEQWDCTAVQDMTIANLEIDGKPRRVLMQAPKNGFLYVLDAATGEFISAEKIAKVTWAEKIDPQTGRPVENPAMRFEGLGDKLFELWPGPQGAHSWLPQAFSPRTGLVYIPIMEMGALFGPPQPNMTGITANMGVTMIPDPDLPESRRSYLRAWDPVKQQEAFTIDLPGDWPGGVLATAGDLIFQGRMDGYLKAYNASTGEEVWSWKTASPVVAAPIAYSVDGREYITVLTGNGSQGGGLLATGNAAYRTDYRLPRRVLTFAIDGAATPPDVTLPERVPLEDPDFIPDPEKIQAGALTFHSGCLVCHGMQAIGGGAAPDLRYSPMILSAELFQSVVRDGALKPRGMPPSPQLSTDELENMRHYLRFRAMQAAQAAGGEAGAEQPATPQISTGT